MPKCASGFEVPDVMLEEGQGFFARISRGIPYVMTNMVNVGQGYVRLNVSILVLRHICPNVPQDLRCWLLCL